jgi:ectoine hydroxylase-related dioxygenase (phytanoyl-CoA dioxygenase family)
MAFARCRIRPPSLTRRLIPGSHHDSRLRVAKDLASEPPGAVTLSATAGTALILNPRVWHTGGPNRSGRTRKMLYYAYAYRWIRPRKNPDPNSERMARLTPVRRQLAGAGAAPETFHFPGDDDVSLRRVVEQRLWHDEKQPDLAGVHCDR